MQKIIHYLIISGIFVVISFSAYFYGVHTGGQAGLDKANAAIRELQEFRVGMAGLQQRYSINYTGLSESVGRLRQDKARAEYIASELLKQREQDRRTIERLQANNIGDGEAIKRFEDANREFDSILSKYPIPE